MDVILSLADDYVLDSVWAWALPAIPRSASDSTIGSYKSTALGASSKIASPSSSAISNLTASLANAWSSRNSAAADSIAGQVMDAAADFESLKGVSAWGRDNIIRQSVSLYAITLLGIFILYFGFATLSYYCFFNHEMKKHPRFLKNQVALEIKTSLDAFLPLDAMTLPWFLAEVRGHSMLYDKISDYGLTYAILSVPFFLVFTDFCIYWIHRIEHHPRIYKHIHKPHHKWLGESFPADCHWMYE
jgi:lathosterol oxidase